MRYFVKSRFRGWVEVAKENYDRFRENIINCSTPTSLTPIELADNLTRCEITTTAEGGGE